MGSMELKNKKVLVVGLGRSGAASAIFLQDHGARVIVSDSKSEAQLQGDIPALLDRGISIETGQHGERTFRDQDLIIVSPGVPSDQPQLLHARSLGIPVIGEVELAFRFLQGKVLAITGSNGKTTTTTLAGEILSKSGKKTLVGGNIGTPVISLAGKSTADSLVVLEISDLKNHTDDAGRRDPEQERQEDAGGREYRHAGDLAGGEVDGRQSGCSGNFELSTGEHQTGGNSALR